MPTAADATLALLLLLQQPGRSPYSRIEIEECGERCQQTPVCAEETLSCAPPRWSPRRQRFIRLETYREGLQRYADIASVMTTVAAETPHWMGSDEDLVRLMLSVAYHESGFRRDVHEGSVRGDCLFREVAGVQEAIPGTCRSHCLGQIYLLPEQRTERGYVPDQLVGLGRAATTRCVQTMADRLTDANRACSAQRNQRGVHPDCTFAMYGGVASYQEDPRIKARVRSYERLRRSDATLTDEVIAVLDADP